VKAHIQRVARCEVRVGGKRISSVGRGLLVLVGVGKSDTREDARFLAKKVVSLRIFEDEEGRMNLPVTAVQGEVMIVSQFTLLADTRRGNRPGFQNAADPDLGETLYEEFCDVVDSLGVPVKTGRFGAFMEVELVNDGPVTILLQS